MCTASCTALTQLAVNRTHPPRRYGGTGSQHSKLAKFMMHISHAQSSSYKQHVCHSHCATQAVHPMLIHLSTAHRRRQLTMSQ